MRVGDKTKRVFLRTFGCQMNVRDSEVLCGLLQKEGYALTSSPEGADIVIFNTCSVRQHAEDKVWSEVGRIAKLHKRKPPKNNTKNYISGKTPLIGIVGCMAQNYKDSIFQRAPEVDFAVGPSDIEKIPGIISRLLGHVASSVNPALYETKVWETDGKLRPEDIYHTGFYEDKEHAYVVISEGCSNYCTYCVVPYVRGELHNRSQQDILREVSQAIDRGISKITLLGQNVNAYAFAAPHRESAVNFPELLYMINEIKGLKEFSFITSHPKDTTVELFNAMASLEKLKKCLHLPVQSGSDRILQLMNRGYTRKFYLDLIEKYRTIVPDGQLTTDIIVGFPSETEIDYHETVDLVRSARFNAAFLFKYSPRPHTKACAVYPDDVPKQEKERRHQEILALQKSISKARSK